MRMRKSNPRDMNVLAAAIVRSATDAPAQIVPESKYATAGRLGGKIGARIRAASLSPERRSEIARKAANARWSKNQDADSADS